MPVQVPRVTDTLSMQRLQQGIAECMRVVAQTLTTAHGARKRLDDKGISTTSLSSMKTTTSPFDMSSTTTIIQGMLEVVSPTSILQLFLCPMRATHLVQKVVLTRATTGVTSTMAPTTIPRPTITIADHTPVSYTHLTLPTICSV